MERPPSSPVSSIASYGWNGQPSPTLIARLTNTVRIHTPRRSTFPRPVASVLDRITSFVQRIAAAAPSRPSGTKIIMLVLFALGTALAVISLILLDFVITAPFAITEVKYIDCSAGRREACTIVRVPAAEYVLDPIVLYEPREHQ